MNFSRIITHILIIIVLSGYTFASLSATATSAVHTTSINRKAASEAYENILQQQFGKAPSALHPNTIKKTPPIPTSSSKIKKTSSHSKTSSTKNTKNTKNKPSPVVTEKEVGINAKYFPVTLLSEKAMLLKVGMTRSQVFELLGRPTWAQRHQGTPLEWTWSNGNCGPIDVTFNNHMRVTGFDQGRNICLDEEFTDVPGDEYSCENTSVAVLCQMDTQFPEAL
jgi:hypothetical protein